MMPHINFWQGALSAARRTTGSESQPYLFCFKIQSAAPFKSSTITARLSGSGDFRSSFAP
jgi:hypothetical protein